MAANRNGKADELQLHALIEDLSRALRAKDADGVAACQTEDAVQFSLAPPLRSLGPGTDGLQAWFATWTGPIGYEVHDLTVEASDELAFCHSLNRLSGTKTEGEEVDVWFRRTLGFCKVGGDWKIVHEHESVPFYMDGSFRAAVDLEP